MATFFKAEVYGVKEWNFRVKLLERSTREMVARELEKQGTIVQRRAKEIITEIPWETGPHGLRRSSGEVFGPEELVIGHVDRGDLRQSISVSADVGFLGDMVVYIGTDLYYGPFVESLPDGGFLFPAFEEVKPEVLAALKGAMQRIIQQTSERK